MLTKLPGACQIHIDTANIDWFWSNVYGNDQVKFAIGFKGGSKESFYFEIDERDQITALLLSGMMDGKSKC